MPRRATYRVQLRAEFGFAEAASQADDVVAFTRGEPACVLSLVQRRSLRRRGNWANTAIVLPVGRWQNLCDGGELCGEVCVADLLGQFPVALLERSG